MRILLLISVFIRLLFNKSIHAQWEQCNNGLNSLGIGPIVVRGNDLFAGTVKGIFHSTNNGDSWVENNQGLPQKFLNIKDIAIYENNIFAGIKGIGIYLSTDNGYSWTGKNNGLTEKLISCLAFRGKNIFVGSDNGVFLSTDNGENWTQKDSGISLPYIISLATRENKVYAGVEGLGVYISTDNGDYWTQKNNGLKHLMFYSLVINGNDIIAGSYLGGIFISTDNGESWTQKNNGLLDTGVYRVAVYGKNIFAGTSRSSGVFLSTNYGDSWSQLNEGLTDLSINSFAIKDTYIFAGTGKGGIFRAKLSDLGINKVEEKPNSKNDIYFVTPNPADDFLMINFKDEYPKFIRLFDSFGNVVYENRNIIESTSGVTPDAVKIRTSELASGIYFLRIGNGIVRKVLVVH